MNAREKVQVEDLIQEVKVLKAHLSKRLVKMEGHLYDDKDTNQDGLIHRVEDLDEKVDKILWEIRWAKKLVIIVSTFVGGVVSLVSKYLFN
jgi:hypothetical protein